MRYCLWVQLVSLQLLKETQGRCSRTMCMQPTSAWTSRVSSQARNGGGARSVAELKVIIPL